MKSDKNTCINQKNERKKNEKKMYKFEGEYLTLLRSASRDPVTKEETYREKIVFKTLDKFKNGYAEKLETFSLPYEESEKAKYREMNQGKVYTIPFVIGTFTGKDGQRIEYRRCV